MCVTIMTLFIFFVNGEFQQKNTESASAQVALFETIYCITEPWNSTTVLNQSLINDPTTQQPGFNLQH